MEKKHVLICWFQAGIVIVLLEGYQSYVQLLITLTTVSHANQHSVSKYRTNRDVK